MATVAKIGATEYATLQAAFDAVVDGQTIEIQAGDYTETVSWGATTLKDITIKGAVDAEGNSLVNWTGGIECDKVKFDGKTQTAVTVKDINFKKDEANSFIVKLKECYQWTFDGCSFVAEGLESADTWNPISCPSGANGNEGHTIQNCTFVGGVVGLRVNQDATLGYAVKVENCSITNTCFNLQSAGEYDVIFKDNDVVFDFDVNGKDGDVSAFITGRSDVTEADVAISGGSITLKGDATAADSSGWGAITLDKNYSGSIDINDVTIKNTSDNAFISNITTANNDIEADLRGNTFVDEDDKAITDAKKIAEDILNLQSGNIAIDYSEFKDAAGKNTDETATLKQEDGSITLDYTKDGKTYVYIDDILTSEIAENGSISVDKTDITRAGVPHKMEDGKTKIKVSGGKEDAIVEFAIGDVYKEGNGYTNVDLHKYTKTTIGDIFAVKDIDLAQNAELIISDVYGDDDSNSDIKIGKKAIADFDSINLGEGKNSITIGAQADVDVVGDVANARKITIKSGEEIARTSVVIGGRILAAEYDNDIKIGDYADVTVLGGIINDKAYGTTLKIGKESTFSTTANDINYEDLKGIEKLVIGEGSLVDVMNIFASEDAKSIKIDDNATLDAADITGFKKITVEDDATLDAANIVFTDEKNTFKIDDDAFAEVVSINFGDGKDKLSLDDDAELIVYGGDLNFGDGKDKLSLDDGAVLKVYGNISGLEKISLDDNSELWAENVNFLANIDGDWSDGEIFHMRGVLDGPAISGTVYENEWDVYDYYGDGKTITFGAFKDIEIEYSVGDGIWNRVEGGITTDAGSYYQFRVAIDTEFKENESKGFNLNVTIA